MVAPSEADQGRLSQDYRGRSTQAPARITDAPPPPIILPVPRDGEVEKGSNQEYLFPGQTDLRRGPAPYKEARVTRKRLT